MIDLDAIPDELQDRDQWLMWDSSADTPGKVLVSLDVVNELRFGDVDPVIIIRFAA